MTERALKPGQADVEFQRQLYEDKNPTRRGLHRSRRDWVLDQALQMTKKGDRVLEVGVGCGVFTEALSEAGREVSAVDINPAFLDNVAPLSNVHIHLKDATKPLELGRHDLAICSEVLEHVSPESSVAMLKTLAGSLRSGGVLILTTPQSFSTVEIAARLFKFPPILALARRLYGHAEELGHINLLTVGQIRRQFDEAGLEVVSHRRFGMYLPILAEFGGVAGSKVLRMLERAIRQVPVLRGLLWTQGWVLRSTR